MDPSVEKAVLCAFSLMLVWMWIRWRRKRLNIFKELGIPGPPPSFLFGNILELNRKGPFCFQADLIQKYGKIVGYFQGLKPILLVADPDLLRKIFIKDFHLFSDRPESIPMRIHSFLDPIIPAGNIMDSLLTNLKGEKWKEVRSILSPTFSAKKLKTMIPAVDKITDVAVSIVEKKSGNGKEVNIYEILQRLTLDIISAQAFAMDIDSQHNPSDPLLRSAKIIFDLPYKSKIIFLGRCFPELQILAMLMNFLQMFIRNKGNIPPLRITHVVEDIIRQRRKNPDMRRPDLLQLLIDASSTGNDEEMRNSSSESCNHLLDDPKISRKKLTDLEIKSNSLVVFLGGYETTSAALSYAFHFLAKYPEIQKKLQHEIDKMIEKEGELDYYNVTNFQQMERFVLETMRFYPPGVNFVSRISVTDVNYDYIRIPKGLQIDVPVHYIHHSEEYFERPLEFNPDRFIPGNGTKNHTVSYWAFGVGPRNCIGKRLVHLTTKIILARILYKFTVLPSDVQFQLRNEMRASTMVPSKVMVKLKHRHTPPEVSTAT